MGKIIWISEILLGFRARMTRLLLWLWAIVTRDLTHSVQHTCLSVCSLYATNATSKFCTEIFTNTKGTVTMHGVVLDKHEALSQHFVSITKYIKVHCRHIG